MKYELLNNNKAFLIGNVIEEPIFSHETFGEGFYETKLSVPRLSEHVDILPVIVSEKMIKNFNLSKDVGIKGQFRSFNKLSGNKNKLILSIFAREIIEIDKSMNPNIIEISGFVCKEPIYRLTPFNREICDILIAVNRAYNKSDYLPCIAWGRNARYIKEAKIGSKIDIVGRIQSRDYQKKLESGDIITRTAYEISISRVMLIQDEATANNSLKTAEIE
ncbi:MAG: single-stranded DNA-binding protein [Clostridia bacterium]|jgi:primosomal replication protein N|nr:single-stranded DNA-binding protein [Clostridia bacterium]MDD3231968.1 single-stranded DNA-binding protein [Clostridia bacterium]MDD3862404.1 single-stranded DNA-binding protein [Clostridia bacterium]